MGPALRHPVGSGAVDDPGVVVVDEGHRFHGGGVGQAEEDQVGRVEELLPLGGVLALVLVDQKKLDVLPGGQAVVYLQAGGALLAVDVYFRLVHMLLLLYLRWAVNSSIRLICFSTLSRAGPP